MTTKPRTAAQWRALRRKGVCPACNAVIPEGGGVEVEGLGAAVCRNGWCDNAVEVLQTDYSRSAAGKRRSRKVWRSLVDRLKRYAPVVRGLS
jgi:hypothetical protein